MKKSRAILGAVLGLALTVPLSPLSAQAAGGRWEQIDHQTRRYFIPDSEITKQRQVLSTSEKLISSSTQTQKGRLIKSGADPVGAVTYQDVPNPDKDKVTIIPGAAEQIGDDWVEYETVQREKAYNRFYTQNENKYDLYNEQTRTANTYQITEKVRITESWTDPVTKQLRQHVTDTTETRNEVRYSGWTENNKQIRVDAGTSPRTWGPDLIYVKVPDEKRIAKRQPIVPPGGLAAGWFLVNTETFRHFVAGTTPPDGVRPATEARAAEMRTTGDEWVLVNSETIRFFHQGTTPPQGGVAASPEQRDAMVNPVNSGWILANSELIRYFVPGPTPPKDAQLADAQKQAEMKAGVSSEWYLVNVEHIRNFIHGNVPPQDATRSDEPAGFDPILTGDWALNHVQSFRFFVPIPGDFENPIPPKPDNPAPIVKLDAITKYPEKAWTEYGEIRKERQGLLIRKFQPVTQVVPRTQTEITIHQAYNLQTYTTYENREIPVNLGGGTEMMTFQVPVKNYRWVLEEVNRTYREVPYPNLYIALGERELPAERANEVGALASANAERPSTFKGDAGSSGKATLSAAKLREQMGANAVKASEAAMTAEELEEAKRVAEEQVRQAAEEERRRQAEEEEKRKAEREAVAKAEQERKAAEEAAAEAAREAARKAEEEAAKKGRDAQEKLFKDAYEAAKKAIEDTRKQLTQSFKDSIGSVLDMLDPFTSGKDKLDSKHLEKNWKEIEKNFEQALKDLEKSYEDRLKNAKDTVALTEILTQYQKDIAAKQAEMNQKIKEANNQIGRAILEHVSKGGTMRTGEQADVNGQSVKAFYSHDTGRWIIFGYPSQDYKGDPVIIATGVDPRKSGKDTPIKDFTYNGVKLSFLVDYSWHIFYSVYDATIVKK